MSKPQIIFTVETDLFEHREVKPHFINPCCFGEDFASWLRGKLTPLTAEGFLFADPIQEDYGWGFWASHRKDRFWIALSSLHSRLPDTEGGVCVRTVNIVGTISDLRKDGLIASRPITAGGTDGADGSDAIFTTRAHLDHSGSCAAFTRE